MCRNETQRLKSMICLTDGMLGNVRKNAYCNFTANRNGATLMDVHIEGCRVLVKNELRYPANVVSALSVKWVQYYTTTLGN